MPIYHLIWTDKDSAQRNLRLPFNVVELFRRFMYHKYIPTGQFALCGEGVGLGF
jgi:hypothetical protein